MKKLLVLVLAIAVVMSMALPTAALVSPHATKNDLKPGLTKESQEIVRFYTLEEILELDQTIQDLMAEAKGALKEACPEGFAVRYLFYVDILIDEDFVNVIFEPIDHSEILFKQYIDGAWTDLEFTVNSDGTITVYNMVEAPLAIFTK